MRETLRSACRNLLRRLSALAAFARSGTRSLLARLRPGIASLGSAARSVVASVPAVLDRLRSASANLVRRLASTLAPSTRAHAGQAVDGGQDYAELLADLGAEPPTPEQAADPTLADTTIRALSDNLRGLRDLGDQLARTEQDRLALAARVEELEAEVEADACGEDAAVERLERKLEQREGVLARTRERLARQRAATDEWKSKAAERWHEINSLRKQVKELERALEEARDAAQPGPLPKRPASGSRQEPRAGRRSSRAS